MSIRTILPVFLLSLCFCISDTRAQSLRTVAFTGVPIPGSQGGISFSTVGSLSLNNSGQTAFFANLEGPGIDFSNNGSIWSEGTGTLEIVAREGDQSPGLPDGTRFENVALTSVLLNAAGQTAFRAFVIDSEGQSTNSIWSGGSGSLDLVARAGQQAPGLPVGTNFAGFELPVFNSAGEVGLRATLVNSDGYFGSSYWSGDAGSLSHVARRGDHAPGLPLDVSFRSFDGVAPTIGSTGQLAFRGQLQGPGVDLTNDFSIWSEGSGSLTMLAREGSQAPGTPAGTVFDFFNYPAFNSAGHTAFRATITGSGVPGIFSDDGIWSEGSGVLDLVAREGDAAPDIPEGANFVGFNIPVINSSSHVAFAAKLSANSNHTGIWSEGAGEGLALVVREGSPAPGTESGVVFETLEASLVLNGRGKLAFMTEIVGPGVDESNNLGIWAQDETGSLRLIVRTGDMLDVDNGPGTDLRSIRYLTGFGGAGNDDGRPSSFNDRGQIAFRAVFWDGTSGIFVSNLVAIPEPSTTCLALAATLLLVTRWSRGHVSHSHTAN